MQQFVVPQFIDVEDKIFGPITIRQFIILLAAGMVIFLAYRYADFGLFLTTTVLFGGFSAVFAFARPNGQAFHYFLLNIIQSFRKPNLRVWGKSYSKKELNYLRKIEKLETGEIVEKKETRSEHIRDLALVVNTGGFYKPDDEL